MIAKGMLSDKTILIQKSSSFSKMRKQDIQAGLMDAALSNHLTPLSNFLYDASFRDNENGTFYEAVQYMEHGLSFLHCIPQKIYQRKYGGDRDETFFENAALKLQSRILAQSTEGDEDALYELLDFESYICATGYLSDTHFIEAQKKRMKWLMKFKMHQVSSEESNALYYCPKSELYWEHVKFQFLSDDFGQFGKAYPRPEIFHCVDEVVALHKYSGPQRSC